MVQRPSQDTPDALVSRLLATVRGQFCADLSPKEWAQQTHFIRRNVVLWPARFMWQKGFTLPSERYESIMRGIFQDIKQCGKTGAIKYWPGYLMHCVQQHWSHHWEEYYDESKSITSQIDHLLSASKPVPVDKTVEALAMAHQVLTKTSRRSRPVIQPLLPL